MFKHEPFSRGKKKILNTFFPIEQKNKKNQRSFFYSTFSNKKEFVFMFKHEPFSRGKKKILNWGRWPTGSVVLCSVCCVCVCVCVFSQSCFAQVTGWLCTCIRFPPFFCIIKINQNQCLESFFFWQVHYLEKDSILRKSVSEDKKVTLVFFLSKL